MYRNVTAYFIYYVKYEKYLKKSLVSLIPNHADSNFLIQLNSKTFEISNPTLNHALQDISDIISVTVGD